MLPGIESNEGPCWAHVGRADEKGYGSGGQRDGVAESDTRLGKALDPASAGFMSEGAEAGEKACGEVEFGLEVGGGIDPGIGIEADAEQQGGEVRVDGSGVAGQEEATGQKDEVEIVGFGDR